MSSQAVEPFFLSPRKERVLLNDFDRLLQAVLAQARALGIPVSSQIDPHVAVNRRAVTRFGCCICKDGRFTIELTARLLDAPEQACRQTLAHEILHTCPGCRNHGPRWKHYAQRMNAASPRPRPWASPAASRHATCCAVMPAAGSSPGCGLPTSPATRSATAAPAGGRWFCVPPAADPRRPGKKSSAAVYKHRPA